MRGNNLLPFVDAKSLIGSPPLAREQPTTPSAIGIRLGITPACAGTTRQYRQGSTRCEDHPRLRGNNHPGPPGSFLCLGSPPLAREQPDSAAADRQETGITPACAGTTRCSRLPFWRHWGSPPLAREQHEGGWRMTVDQRITPACAGTTELPEEYTKEA